jgi:hypothetical protein
MSKKVHGIALSSDYFIQGAPTITAKAAGIENPFQIMNASIPLWATMSIVTAGTAFFMMRRDLKNKVDNRISVELPKNIAEKYTTSTRIVAILTPLVFLLDAYLMFRYKLRGGDATALVGGTAVIVSL